ncbi:DedA family protein [Peptococcaceae bacterium 1198_IL3148]
MEQFIDTILQYLIKLGTLGLLIGIFIDGLGVPFPGGFMIIISGILIQRGDISFFEVLLVVFVGHLSGSSAAYFIGQRVGLSFVERFGRYLRITGQRLAKGQHWLEQSAAAFIILGRFIPTIGNVTPYLAGVGKIKYLWFFIYSCTFVTLWTALNISIGYIFGHSWQQASAVISSKLWLVGVFLLLLFVAYKYYNNKNKERNGV